jgi:alkanesulfonate monooxygenase SsuD/methylene tetrahydromethanopterin reductase-like flavin-dependent oxidoreductase (luciferase family)
VPKTRFGLQLWSQQTDWPGFRDAALAAEGAGFDSIWTWDHLMAIFGPWEQPIFEGWSVLAGLGAVTSRVRLGLMVGANTFRNPGLTAKLATTLDNISRGRAVLGIGGAWFEREHDGFGIEFFGSPGERLDRLDESVMLMRRLLDGERFSHEGRFYTMQDALCAPRPIQTRLPILVGGSGPRKTLRIVATRADGWNTSGPLEEVRGTLDILGEHCSDVGRDISTIEKTVSFPIVIRDDRAAAEAAYGALMAHNGVESMGGSIALLGAPTEVADALRPYRELGFATVIVRMAAPYDRETIERMAEVQELLGA